MIYARWRLMIADVKQFSTNVPLLYPLKGSGSGAVVENGLR